MNPGSRRIVGCRSCLLDIYLVDGTYERFRYYYALPSPRDQDGQEVAAVRGVLSVAAGYLTHRVSCEVWVCQPPECFEITITSVVGALTVGLRLSRTGFKSVIEDEATSPQGLKPAILLALNGTAEAVPSQNRL